MIGRFLVCAARRIGGYNFKHVKSHLIESDAESLSPRGSFPDRISQLARQVGGYGTASNGFPQPTGKTGFRRGIQMEARVANPAQESTLTTIET